MSVQAKIPLKKKSTPEQQIITLKQRIQKLEELLQLIVDQSTNAIEWEKTFPTDNLIEDLDFREYIEHICGIQVDQTYFDEIQTEINQKLDNEGRVDCNSDSDFSEAEPDTDEPN